MKLSVGKTYTVTITEIAGLGDGVAYVDGHKLFVPYTAKGDEVEVRITKTGKEFSQGEVLNVISPGESRQMPECKHFYQCGGCSLQHIKQQEYSEFKRNILVQAVSRAGLDINNVAPLVYIGNHSRRRTVLKVQQGKIGYYKEKSHDIFSVEECPILEKPLENLVPTLKPLLKLDSTIYEISLSLSDSGIDMVIHAKKEPSLSALETLTEFAGQQDLAGISWQREKGEFIPVVERRAAVMEVTEDIVVNLPTGSFQQATKAGQEAITKEILAATAKSKNMLDLYAGCGGYSFAMASYAKVHAVEGDAMMTKTVTDTARKYSLSAVVTAEQRDLVRQPFQEKALNNYDAVVINPPRNGAKAQSEYLAKSNVKLIVMVSCNPVTFSTDARLLAEGGYRLARAVPIDQFVFSSHLECVAIFEK